MNLTLKDVPEALHQRLREAAENSGRSLNKLVIHTLEQSFCARQSDRTALVDRIRRRRQGMQVWLDDQTLESAIAEGRS